MLFKKKIQGQLRPQGPSHFLGQGRGDEVVPVKVFRSCGLVENLASPVRLEFAYFIL